MRIWNLYTQQDISITILGTLDNAKRQHSLKTNPIRCETRNKIVLTLSYKLIYMSKGKEPEITVTDHDPSVNIAQLIPYVDKIQSSGNFSLADAYYVGGAIDFLNGNTEAVNKIKDIEIPGRGGGETTMAEVASHVVITAIIRGQARGAFTLAEAGQLATLLQLVKKW